MLINCALIGKGYWGSKIVNYINGENGFYLKYIAGSKFDKNIIWHNSGIEAVFVITPMETHYEIVKDALNFGKHVFVDKPITLKVKEAEELMSIASDNGLSVVVDYVHTFSKGLNAIVENIESIGKIQYIEAAVKHLGRFMEYDVYWLLASHMLSVLDMFVDLNSLKFTKEDHIVYNGMATTGSIKLQNDNVSGTIDVSINFTEKDLYFYIYGENGTAVFTPLVKENPVRIKLYNKKYMGLPDDLIHTRIETDFDEMNNLNLAVRYFSEAIKNNSKSNLDRAIKITRILENLDRAS